MINDLIAAAEQELAVRRRAAMSLKGIPAQQNQTAIARLYDRLVALNIDRYETTGRVQ